MIGCCLTKEDYEAAPDAPDALFLVKWLSLPYSECTWETRANVDDDHLIKEFWERQVPPSKVCAVPPPSSLLSRVCD